MNHLNELKSYGRSFIECRVRQLAGSYRIHPNDFEDFRQELYLDLLERIPKNQSRLLLFKGWPNERSTTFSESDMPGNTKSIVTPPV